MKVTVVVCTYNRCESLYRALDSIAHSTVPPSIDWEVLVVDNNSSDKTDLIAGQFCRDYPQRFRYIFQPRLGLCHSRNAGIEAARGEIVIFTDDDVRVGTDWVCNLAGVFDNPNVSAGCGKVLPDWSSQNPEWISKNGPYTWERLPWLFDLGNERRLLQRPPIGANMAFRKSMFEKYGGFRLDLGRVGKNLMSGEDTEFGSRLLAGGEQLRYEPSAVVYHSLQEERLTEKYLESFWFALGQTMIRETGKSTPFFGIPRHYFSILKISIRTLQAAIQWVFVARPEPKIRYKARLWIGAGQIAERWRLITQRDELKA
jgi:glycosyltransferase involved in cell wall biosynthesis